MRMELHNSLRKVDSDQIARAEFERMLNQKHSSILVVNFDHEQQQFNCWGNFERPKWPSFVKSFFKELELAIAQQTSGN